MIGQPLSRIDGPLKVSGRATYAYEQWDAGQSAGQCTGWPAGHGRRNRRKRAAAAKAEADGTGTGSDAAVI